MSGKVRRIVVLTKSLLIAVELKNPIAEPDRAGNKDIRQNNSDQRDNKNKHIEKNNPDRQKNPVSQNHKKSPSGNQSFEERKCSIRRSASRISPNAVA